MTETTLHEIADLIEVALDRDPGDVTLETRLFEDLAFDSIGLVALIVEIQRKFKVRIPEDDIKSLRTVADVIMQIEKHKAQMS